MRASGMIGHGSRPRLARVLSSGFVFGDRDHGTSRRMSVPAFWVFREVCVLDLPHERLTLDRIRTPLGQALLITDESHRLRALDWEDHAPPMQRLLRLHYGSTMALEGGRPLAARARPSRLILPEASSNSTASHATRVVRPSSVRFGRHCGRSRRDGR
jgi:hypothetical protein